MSKFDFSDEEFAGRLSRARQAIGNAGFDWMILFHPVTIRWLTGSDAKSYQEFQCLLVSAEPGPLIILTRTGEANEFRDDARVDLIATWGGGEPEDPIAALEALLTRHGIHTARMGMEVPAYYLHPHHYLGVRSMLGERLVAEATTLIHDLTLIKSTQELLYIREAARLADLAMQRFVGALAVGRTELELAAEVYHALLSSGSGLAGSPINLVTGERTCFSHGAPTDRRLRAADNGNIEYGATFKRYTATIGRQFCVGSPTSRVKELFQLVCEASDVCRSKIRAGAPAQEPHNAAKRVIADAGLDRARVHLSGYGLAPGSPPGWAEPIHLFGNSSYTLQAGMVVTIEPPVFLSEEPLGVRIIDNVLVTEDGAELLTRFPRDLILTD